MMTDKNLAELIKAYQEVVYPESPVRAAYFELIHFVRKLSADFPKLTTDYKAGGVSQGYMDYTYFPFHNDDLRKQKLRYGIVLNHYEMQFELWLMGQNAKEQLKYWDQLKDTPWNQHLTEMPIYSVLEAVIVAEPDFTDLDQLSTEIIKQALLEVDKINQYL